MQLRGRALGQHALGPKFNSQPPKPAKQKALIEQANFQVKANPVLAPDYSLTIQLPKVIHFPDLVWKPNHCDPLSLCLWPCSTVEAGRTRECLSMACLWAPAMSTTVYHSHTPASEDMKKNAAGTNSFCFLPSLCRDDVSEKQLPSHEKIRVNI